MYIFSCDLGGTYTKWGMFKDGKLIEHGEFESKASQGGEALLNTLVLHIKKMVASYPIEGIAVSSAGTIDSLSGEVIQASEIIPGYKGMNIKKILHEAFDIHVHVDNDVNCAMYAEAIDGAGKNSSIVFGLTLGTGVGSAIIINNNIYHGSHYFAGEIGYLMINNEKLDLSGSTRGLAKREAKRKKEDESLWDGKKVFEGYFKQDVICIEEIERMTQNIAEVIKLSICFLNPQVIVLGGGILAQKDVLLPLIRDKVATIVPSSIYEKTSIKAAQFGNLAGIYGAYYLYKKNIKET